MPIDPAAEVPAEVSAWWAQPTADALAPVGPRWVAEHRALMVDVSSGRGASPLYREPWSEMSVILELQSYNQPYLPMSLDDAQSARSLAFASATTAANALVLRKIDESPLLSNLDRARRTLTSPTLERHEHGLTLVPGRPQAARNRALEEARLLEPGRTSQRLPRVGLVNGLSLRPLDDAEGNEFEVVWNTAFLAQNTAIDNLRLSAELTGFDPFDDAPLNPALSWSAVAQQQFIPRWFIQADARSVPGSLEPLQARAGLAWQLWSKDLRWMLRATGTYGFTGAEGRDPVRRVELRLQWNGPWDAPIPAEPPYPGARAGVPAPWPRDYFVEENSVSFKAGVPLVVGP